MIQLCMLRMRMQMLNVIKNLLNMHSDFDPVHVLEKETVYMKNNMEIKNCSDYHVPTAVGVV